MYAVATMHGPPDATPLSVAHDLDAIVRRLADPAVARVDLVRAPGSTLGLLVAALARKAGAPPVLVVTADTDEARRIAADVAFFGGSPEGEEAAEEGRGDVLLLPATESSPYAEVAPDRRAAMARLATLFHLSLSLIHISEPTRPY